MDTGRLYPMCDRTESILDSDDTEKAAEVNASKAS